MKIKKEKTIKLKLKKINKHLPLLSKGELEHPQAQR